MMASKGMRSADSTTMVPASCETLTPVTPSISVTSSVMWAAQRPQVIPVMVYFEIMCLCPLRSCPLGLVIWRVA